MISLIMNKTTHLRIPLWAWLSPILLAVIGIVVGSFLDLQISQKIANPTSYFLESEILFIVYLFYPLSGVCLYKAFVQKKEKALGVFSLVFCVIWGCYKGQVPLRYNFGSSSGSILPTLYSILISGTVMALASFLFLKIVKDDANPSYLIRLALLFLFASLFALNFGGYFKDLASRPRYRYLIANNIDYRPWWSFIPYTDSVDGLKSFPSGHMIMASFALMLPLFHPVWKGNLNHGELYSFFGALLYVLFTGFTRIYAGAHFLSDVCFGLLFGYFPLVLTAYFMIEPFERDLYPPKSGKEPLL